jgi:ubiquinone biosynthesis protein
MKPFNVLNHAVRAKEIVTVLTRQGFEDLLDQIDLPNGIWRGILPKRPERRSTGERIRRAAEQLGPAFVKLGQILSMRPDLLPHDIILELGKLQDQVDPLPFDAMKPVLTDALGCEPGDFFQAFDEEAIASASIAQVYSAQLKDGTEVVVKLQKPGLRRRIEVDFDLAVWLSELLAAKIPVLRALNLPGIVADSRAAVIDELDFRREAKNQEYFNAICPRAGSVFAPRVYPELSGERVLVMEKVNGLSVKNVAGMPQDRRSALAAAGADSILRQVFIEGFFHADPHSGNILVTDDGRVCFLDWGLSGHLTRRLRNALADFWIAAVEQNTERIVQIAADLAPVESRPDVRAMERDVTIALRQELNFKVGRPVLGHAMLRLLYIFGQQGIPLSRDYALMAKSVISIEEVGCILEPEFDLRKHAEPVLLELQKQRSNPKVILNHANETLRHTALALKELPFELRRLLRRLERDNVAFNLQIRGLDQHDHAIMFAANRIALGVIIGALIVGSSLIIITGTKPQILGYPALGIVGFACSAFIGLTITWEILRKGRGGRSER